MNNHQINVIYINRMSISEKLNLTFLSAAINSRPNQPVGREMFHSLICLIPNQTNYKLVDEKCLHQPITAVIAAAVMMWSCSQCSLVCVHTGAACACIPTTSGVDCRQIRLCVLEILLQHHRPFAVIITILHSSSLPLSAHVWLSQLHFAFPLLVSASLTCSRTTSTRSCLTTVVSNYSLCSDKCHKLYPVFHYMVICECVTVLQQIWVCYLQADPHLACFM